MSSYKLSTRARENLQTEAALCKPKQDTTGISSSGGPPQCGPCAPRDGQIPEEELQHTIDSLKKTCSVIKPPEMVFQPHKWRSLTWWEIGPMETFATNYAVYTSSVRTALDVAEKGQPEGHANRTKRDASLNEAMKAARKLKALVYVRLALFLLFSCALGTNLGCIIGMMISGSYKSSPFMFTFYILSFINVAYFFMSVYKPFVLGVWVDWHWMGVLWVRTTHLNLVKCQKTGRHDLVMDFAKVLLDPRKRWPHARKVDELNAWF